jgi:uncharacterized membrane protein
LRCPLEREEIARGILFSVVASLLLFLVLAPVWAAESAGSKERVIESLEGSGMPGVLSAALVSMLPIFELRGGIPVAINYFGMDWPVAYAACVAGNMIPVMPILLFLGGVSKGLSRFALFNRFFDWLFQRTRRKGGLIETYGSLGLMLFVAVPLPVTGAWTGSVAAFLFGMKLSSSFLFILLGVLIAGVIVTILSLLGMWGAILAGSGLACVAVSSFALARRRRRA